MLLQALTILTSVATLHAASIGLDGVSTGAEVAGAGAELVAAALAHGGGKVDLGGATKNSGFVITGDHAENNLNAGVSGAAGLEVHNAGGSSYHDVGQHHSKVTKVRLY